MTGSAAGAVHQVVPVLHEADAIGNEVRVLQDRLRRRGIGSEVFAAEPRPGQRHVRPLSTLLPGPPPAAVLYHYAISSAATDVLAASGLPVVLVHHNVTPSRWFHLVDGESEELCRRAVLELPRLRGHVRLALGDSEFTRRELDAMGFRPTGVLPILVDPRRYAEHRAGVLAAAARRRTVLLTVGRVAPHKRIDDAVRLLHAYRRGLDPDAQLWVAGDADRLPVYRRALDRLVAGLGEEDAVRFLGRVGDGELLDCYHGAAVYVSMSEHEGFGVPLLEAMLCGLPVLARAAAAVPSTLGAAGVQVRGRDFALMAEVLGRLLRDPPLRATQVELGRRRAADLDPDRAVDGLLDSLAAAGMAPSA